MNTTSDNLVSENSLNDYITDFKNSPITFKPVYSYKKLKDGSTKRYAYENKKLSTTTIRTTFMKNMIIFNYDKIRSQGDKKSAEDITALYQRFHPEDKDYVYSPKKINVFKLHEALQYIEKMNKQQSSTVEDQQDEPTIETSGESIISEEDEKTLHYLVTSDRMAQPIRFESEVEPPLNDMFNPDYIIAKVKFDFTAIKRYYGLMMLQGDKYIDKNDVLFSSVLSHDLWLMLFLQSNFMTLYHELKLNQPLLNNYDTRHLVNDDREHQRVQRKLIRERSTYVVNSLLNQIDHVTNIINLISPYRDKHVYTTNDVIKVLMCVCM